MSSVISVKSAASYAAEQEAKRIATARIAATTDRTKFEQAKKDFGAVVTQLRTIFEDPEYDGAYKGFTEKMLALSTSGNPTIARIDAIASAYITADKECDYQSNRLGYRPGEWYKEFRKEFMGE